MINEFINYLKRKYIYIKAELDNYQNSDDNYYVLLGKVEILEQMLKELESFKEIQLYFKKC